MKIYKIYEKLHPNAGKLTVLITNTFFGELEEFENIYYESSDGENFGFFICFSEIYKETVQQMGKFNEFMGFDKDGWYFKIDTNKNAIYEEFYLGTDKIDNYLKKFEMLNNSQKYNL